MNGVINNYCKLTLTWGGFLCLRWPRLNHQPPLNRKGRVVVRGNHSMKQPQQGQPDPSVGGEWIRWQFGVSWLLRCSGNFAWVPSSMSKERSCMQAPRQSDAIGPRVCDPPSLLKQMNLVGKDEKWLVHKALYSTGSWRAQVIGVFTDQAMAVWITGMLRSTLMTFSLR